MTPLEAISPIDGRYHVKTAPLADYFSEYALIRYRVLVEVRYFQALWRAGVPQLSGLPEAEVRGLDGIVNQFDLAAAQQIKNIERTTNHDVKAVEYFVKQQLQRRSMDNVVEFVHFGLTSQDINNTAIPLSLRDALQAVLYPAFDQLTAMLEELADEWREVAMLAYTHGQPASPTLLGKEIRVFAVRLREQLRQLREVPITAKFGGATGNLNAHYVAYPDRDWHSFADSFVQELGLQRAYPTTQIEHYDNLAAQCHALARINTVLIDLCRDMWTYISMEYFRQRTVAGEVGSSAMPHKVNPIDFENAEGNLGVANALLEHLAAKLPVSRLQRDLTDSTVLRNLGVPLAHTLIAVQSVEKGLSKLLLNRGKLAADLDRNWMVLAEAIQTILRREGFDQPYEALKALTRGRTEVGEADIRAFIEQLNVSEAVREELRALRPEKYTGR